MQYAQYERSTGRHLGDVPMQCIPSLGVHQARNYRPVAGRVPQAPPELRPNVHSATGVGITHDSLSCGLIDTLSPHTHGPRCDRSWRTPPHRPCALATSVTNWRVPPWSRDARFETYRSENPSRPRRQVAAKRARRARLVARNARHAPRSESPRRGSEANVTRRAEARRACKRTPRSRRGWLRDRGVLSRRLARRP